MIDPGSVAITLAVFGIGWLVGRRNRRKATTPSPVQPICLCEHQYGTHHPETGECVAAFMQWVNNEEKQFDCACLRYTGPQPVEQYWVPPAADMSIVTAPRPTEGGGRG